jgi:probable rRNA maturation factor
MPVSATTIMTVANAVEISLTVSCTAWLTLCPEAGAVAERAARAALAGAGPGSAGGPMLVGIVLTDDAEQRDLNRLWRGKDSSTNVLAFALNNPAVPPAPGAPILLGDIVLALETVAREAAAQDKTLPDHLAHLVVHGALHLLGFDHADEGEAALMEARETAILAKLGVAAPYTDTM